MHETTWKRLRHTLPNLDWSSVDWEDASLPSGDYNCVGYVVGDGRWWQPIDSGIPGIDRDPRNYWPPGVPGDAFNLTLDDVVLALQTVGFEACERPEGPQDGYDVAVLIHDKKVFRHACLLIAAGLWRSKCGEYSDFTHTLKEMTGGDYGRELQFIRRDRRKAS